MKLKKWLFKSLIYTGLGLSSTSIAQNDLWVVGQNVVKFNALGVSSISNLPVQPSYPFSDWQPNFNDKTASNSYNDQSGNLLFYITSGKVYDYEGRFIGALQGGPANSFNNLLGHKEIAIVPDKCNPSIFYIITESREVSGHNADVATIFYTKIEIGVDINTNLPNGNPNTADVYGDHLADGRLGFTNSNYSYSYDPITYNSSFGYNPEMNVLFNPASTEGQNFGFYTFAVSKVIDNNRFLFLNSNNGIVIINTNDLEPAALGNTYPALVYSSAATNNQGGNSEFELVQLPPAYPGAPVVLRAANYFEGGAIQRKFFYQDFQYDPATQAFIAGTINNFVTDVQWQALGSNISVKGLEFEPNGRYLYFMANGSPNHLYYLDLNNTANPPVPVSTNPSTYANFKSSQIERAKDGSFYIVNNNGTQLGKISNVSNPATVVLSIVPTPFVNPVLLSIESSNIATPPYNTVFTLNDQVDGEPPYTWSSPSGNTEAEAKCCIEHQKYTIDSYTVTGPYNQTWSPGNNPFLNTTLPVSVKTRLVIPEGYNITIQNMVFEFKPFIGDPNAGGGFTDGAKCILKASNTSLNGARLNLTGTTFKGSGTCYYGMWDGVEVQGVPTAPQLVLIGGYNSKQARLTLNGNSIIQDAYFGATNYAFDLNTSSSLAHETSPLQSGGVIVAQASSFKNNFMGVVFMPYSAATVVSSFKTTNFLVDAPLKNPLIKPFAMAFVFSNKTLSFNKCVFKNSVPSVYPIVNLGSPLQNVHGIFAIDASLTVYGGPSIGVPYGVGCTFENLTYGVRAFNINTNTALIQSSIFKNNWRGSYFSNYTGASVTKVQRNKYFVHEYANGTPAKDAAYGHYLDYCNNFIVQENNFYYNSYNETSGTPVGGVFNAYGCIVNEENPKQLCEKDGYKGDRVYKNLFKEIKFGAQAQGSNSEMPNDIHLALPTSQCHSGLTNTEHNQGLKYVCNTFSGTDENDITVMMNGAINDPGRIAYQQGGATQVAGNVFSHVTTPVNCNSGITSSSERELYVDKTGIDDTKPNYLQYTSNNAPTQQLYCFSPLSIAPNPSSTKINTGADARPIIGTNSCPSQIITLSSTGSTHVFKLLGKQIDDLNQKLIDGDAETLITLINNGSNGQIKTGLLNKSPYLSDRVLITAVNKQLPDGTIKDILLANSPVTVPVKQAVDASNLSNGIKNQIVAAQTGISGRAILESQISQLKDEQHIYEIEALFAAQNDSLIQTTDSVINLIDYFGGEGKTQKKIKVHLSKNDLVKANQELNVLATDLGTGHPDYQYLNTIKEVYGTYNKGALGIINDATALNVIDATSQRTLEYDSKGALGIKEFFRLAANREWIQGKANASSQRLGRTEDESSISVVENNNFKIYPNPSTGIFFYQVLSDELNDATLEVYDLTGKRIISGALSNNNANGYIDLSSVTNGIYFVKVANTQKILFNTKLNVVK